MVPAFVPAVEPVVFRWGQVMALDLQGLLPEAAHRSKRAAFVAEHFPAASGLAHEGAFKGFTATELAAFQVVRVSSMDALNNAIRAMGPDDQRIFECDWDGVSASAIRPAGPKASMLSADPSQDWGYARPGWAVLVRPASGRMPVLKGNFAGAWYWSGASKLELHGLEFEGGHLRFESNATYPCIAMIAFTGTNTLRDITNITGAVNFHAVRCVHAAGVLFENCASGFQGAANYFRGWDCRFRQSGAGDVFAFRGYNHGWTSGWKANLWLAGNIVYDQSQSDALNPSHCDGAQISLNNTANPENHWGYACLYEMNLMHLNRNFVVNGVQIATQGFFGDDGSGFNGDYLVHNNIIAIGAYHGCIAYDPLDDMHKVVTRNLFLRCAMTAALQDTYPWVRGLRSAGASGAGTLEISHNYAAAFPGGYAGGETIHSNIILDPRHSATQGTRYGDLLAGSHGDNGTRMTYQSPDQGAGSAAAAKAAMLAQWRPLAGWGGGAGPANPDMWPGGDYAALASGGGEMGGATGPGTLAFANSVRLGLGLG